MTVSCLSGFFQNTAKITMLCAPLMLSAQVASAGPQSMRLVPPVAPIETTADHVIRISGQANGWNVNTVHYPGGAFTQNQNGGWTESNNNGTFSYVETGRDDWSVYLNAPSRNVQIQLDLHRKVILYGEDGGPRRDQYQITAAQGAQTLVGNPVKQETFNYTCDTGNHLNVIFETGGPVAWAYFTYGGSKRVNLKQVPSNFGSQFTDGNYHMMVDGAQIKLKQSNNGGSDTCYIR